MTTTSANYFTAALGDDLSADQTLGKAEIRRNRIAAAVERSRLEYKPEHAYTERGSSSASVSADMLRVSKHSLEYSVSAMYGRKQYTEALQLILDHKGKAPMDRELLDTGLRCAIRTGNVTDGVQIARESRNSWKGQWAGLACSASDVFKIAGLLDEAIDPLLSSCASFALHEPVLSRLYDLIDPRPELADLARLIESVKSRKRYQTKPIFGDVETPENGLPASSAVPEVQYDDVCEYFADRQRGDLRGTLLRLNKASVSGGDDADLGRGVREL